MKTRLLRSLPGLLFIPALALAQQQFATPEQAASALVDAVSQQNEAALNAILTESWRQYLPPEGADPEAVARFLRDWKTSHHIEQQHNVAWLNVGKQNWQLPIPLVKTADGWRFDMQGAADEILTRTIGRNELSAIQALHAYVQAQREFYALNHFYAQKLISSEGQKDGLYWPAGAGEAPSPLGPAFSPGIPGAGYHGYRFRIITAHADEGRSPWLHEGKLTGGYALIAWPVAYGRTGVTSFMVDDQERVWQAWLGEETARKAQAITSFSPVAPWQQIKETGH